jgi:hypothetical protein
MNVIMSPSIYSFWLPLGIFKHFLSKRRWNTFNFEMLQQKLRIKTNAVKITRRVWRYQREVIRIRISKKSRQHNGQKKKYKRTTNDLRSLFVLFLLFIVLWVLRSTVSDYHLVSSNIFFPREDETHLILKCFNKI